MDLVCSTERGAGPCPPLAKTIPSRPVKWVVRSPHVQAERTQACDNCRALSQNLALLTTATLNALSDASHSDWEMLLE